MFKPSSPKLYPKHEKKQTKKKEEPFFESSDCEEEEETSVPDCENASICDNKSTVAQPSKYKDYPPAIVRLLAISEMEEPEVRNALKGRQRKSLIIIFEKYKDILTPIEYSKIKSALYYLYDFGRVKTIDQDNALWLLGIKSIPTSHIVSYTSKDILKQVAKSIGLPFSGKKTTELVEMIRDAIPNNN